MPLDITAPASHDVFQPSTVTVVTDVVRVPAFSFTVEPLQMVVEVQFLDGGVSVYSELWILSGTPLSQTLNAAAVGTARTEVLIDLLTVIVTLIQTQAGLKESMVAAGDLVIGQGSLVNAMASMKVNRRL